MASGRRWVPWVVAGGVVVVAGVAVGLSLHTRTSFAERLVREGGVEFTLQLDLSAVPDAQRSAAAARTARIIADRLDASGLAHASSVAQVGEDRVVLRIAGAVDSAAVARPLGIMRPLEFRRVVGPEEYEAFLRGLATRIRTRSGSAEAAYADTSVLGKIGVDESPSGEIVGLFVTPDDESALNAVLDSPLAGDLVPAGRQLLWGRGTEAHSTGVTIRRLYLTSDRAEIGGADVVDVEVGPGLDAGLRDVTLQLSREGGRRLADLTASMVGGRLAIVCSSAVVTAPMVRTVIPNGRVSVAGFSEIEAAELAALLRAGAIPAPLQVASSRIIAPGQESGQ